MSATSYTVIEADWKKYGKLIKDIRMKVFVEEQMVPPEIEMDGKDDEAIHVLAFLHQGLAVGTARLLTTGQIGRMAVLSEYRNMGIGAAMLKQLLNMAHDKEVKGLFLNAQSDAIEFYKRFGFVETGDFFTEAGIKHRKMTIGDLH